MTKFNRVLRTIWRGRERRGYPITFEELRAEFRNLLSQNLWDLKHWRNNRDSIHFRKERRALRWVLKNEPWRFNEKPDGT